MNEMNEMNEMNFKDIITDFLETSNVGYYMIHLKRAKERLPVIEKLENDLQIQLTNFEGVDGVELLKTGFPTSCATTPGSTRGPGDIGCTVSHYKLCCLALENNYDYIVIFEDDTILNKSLIELENFLHISKIYLKSVGEDFDLFLLGHGGCVEFDIRTYFLLKSFKFNGTHAIILNKKTMKALKEKYEEIVSKGLITAIDTLYSDTVKQNNLNIFGDIQGGTFFEQNQKLYSYILEGYRT